MRDRIVAVDVETGGTDPWLHSLLEVGLVGPSGEELRLYVREPELSVEREALKVNNIDLEVVRDEGVLPAEALRQIERFLAPIAQRCAEQRPDRRGAPLLFGAHNAHFDWGFLLRLEHLALEPGFFRRFFSHRLVDTHALQLALASAGAMPSEFVGTIDAWSYLGAEIPPGDLHTALGDARGTRRLILNSFDLLEQLR